MIRISPQQYSILHHLAREPWLTADQLTGWSRLSLARIYVHLRPLLEQELVQCLNPRSAHMELRSVYALTDQAVSRLAAQHGLFEPEFRLRHRLTRTRHVNLLWQLERVCSIRDILLRLPRSMFQPGMARTLTRVEFVYRNLRKSLTLHAAGELKLGENQGLPFVVEWELAHLPFDARRLRDLAEWHTSYFEWIVQRSVPVLLFVLPNRPRLEQVWEVLQSARGSWRVLGVYLTTLAQLERQNPLAPIWLSAASGKRECWHESEPARPLAQCGFAFKAESSRARIGRFGPSRERGAKAGHAKPLLDLKLGLSAQAKRMLQVVARRPFLAVGEVAWMCAENADRVGKVLKELEQSRLVEAVRHGTTRRYRLTERGMQYEAAEAGYGRAVKKYHRACGGRSGLKRLGFHLEHTIAINEFFLRWVRLAREKGCRFEWVGEQESARFFRHGSQWHRFLPDGRGIWRRKNGTELRFVLELDRTRESFQNLQAKFRTYWWWRVWRQGHSGEPEPHVLVVTTSWTQADVILSAMRAALPKCEAPCSVWVTTFEELEARGLEAALWTWSGSSGRVRILPCLVAA